MPHERKMLIIGETVGVEAGGYIELYVPSAQLFCKFNPGLDK